MTAVDEDEETVMSQDQIIDLLAKIIAYEPRGVIFSITEDRGNYSLTVDRIEDGEKENLISGTEPVRSRQSVIVLVVQIIQKAIAIQHRSGSNSDSICVSDTNRVVHGLEVRGEAQLKFYH